MSKILIVEDDLSIQMKMPSRSATTTPLKRELPMGCKSF